MVDALHTERFCIYLTHPPPSRILVFTGYVTYEKAIEAETVSNNVLPAASVTKRLFCSRILEL